MEQHTKAVKRNVRPSSESANDFVPEVRTSIKHGGSANGSNGHGAANSAARVAKSGKKFPVGNVYQPECPAQRALETIASKWAILILHSLLEQPLRFNALQRKLTGISQKVLTEQLRRLERFGIIARVVHPTVPPSVEYSLTPAGRELKSALAGLCEWSNKHAAMLMAGEASSAAARGAAKSRAMKAAEERGE